MRYEKPLHRSFLFAVAGLCLATVLALPLDGAVSRWVRATGLEAALKNEWRWLATLMKVPGEYWCAMLAAAVLSVRRIRPDETFRLFFVFIVCSTMAAALKSHMDGNVDMTLKALLSLPGTLFIAFTAIVIVVTRDPALWQNGAFVMLCSLASSLNGVAKWIVGRYRPFKSPPHLDQAAPFYCEPFRGGIAGMFNQTNLAFPSGHGCLAFALATALAILLPRHGRWFYAAATLTAVERFAENAHHLSDSIASAALGVGGAWAVWAIANKVQTFGTDAGRNDGGRRNSNDESMTKLE